MPKYPATVDTCTHNSLKRWGGDDEAGWFYCMSCGMDVSHLYPCPCGCGNQP